LALVLASPSVAMAETNVVGKVTAHADGGKTIVIVHGTTTPSFTAYRLERPSRVVVDLADGRLASQDGPIDVDTWAVSQIGTAQYADESSRTARVMIGFKRPSSYDVRAKGHDVIITITPDETPPPDQLKAMKAQAAEESKRVADLRTQTDSLKAQQDQLRTQTEQLKQEAARQAEAAARQEAARKQAETARRDAEQAASRAAKARADEEARLQAVRDARNEEDRRAQSAQVAKKAESEAQARSLEAQKQADEARQRAQAAQAELERVVAARKAESDRLSKLKDEAARAGEKTNAELQKSYIEMARLREQRVEEQKRLEQLRAEAEQLMQKREEAAKRLGAQQAEERKRQQAETARAEMERQAAERRAASMAAAQQAEERKLAAQAEEAARLRAAADATRKLEATESARKIAEEKAQKEARAAAEAAARELDKVEKLRAEAQRLAADAQAAKMEVNRHRMEAERLFAVQEMERARVERERAEAKKVMEKRAEEAQAASHAAAMVSMSSAKMAEAEAQARKVAAQRQRELAQLEAARAEAQKISAQREAELKQLEAARAEAQKISAQREAELKQLMGKRADEEQRLQKARAELERVDAERRASLDALSRSKNQLSEQQSRLQAAEARLAGQQSKLQAEEARFQGQQSKQQAEAARLAGQQSKLQAENATLEARVASARSELERLEKEARQRLSVVPTPARVAAATPVAPEKAPSPSKLREALPVQKVAARVEDVRFSDEGESERVTVALKGDAECTVLKTDNRTAVLRIARADLPKKLERTLDVAAYQGPLKSISTYTDPDDPGAVRVVANLDANIENGPGQPKLTRDGAQLAWDFPKVQARSYPPQRVGAYGNTSIPLQVGAAPTTLPPGAGPRGKKHVYTGRRISLDFKDIDIHNVLRLLADVGQVNIVTSDDVKGSVTIRMVDVPWDQALDVILKAKGLGMQREGNLIRVAPGSVLEKELEAEIARAKAAVELKPIDTRLISLSYADADKVMPRISDLLSPRGKVSVDARTNMLIVSDVAANIALAEDLVRNLDTQTPQVSIEARIVEARTTFLRDIGIQWGGNSINSAATGNATGIAFPSTVGVAGGATDATSSVNGLQLPTAASPNYVVNLPAPVGTGSGGALGLTLGSVNGAVNINLRLSSLENTGNVRIISAPKITTLDNIEASIEQGVAIPISVVSAAGTNTVFVDAKLNLTVKPHVTNEGSVIMNVAITRNEPDFVNTGARGDPTILKKQAKTEMLVRDGDTAVIGGIYTRNTGLSYAKVPWFADIPVIGWLFKNRRENDDRTELLIFITPRIVNRAGVVRR